ncbi:shikimate kinase [Atopobium fossor]|uniref:shikimate kinase n=1 Tax=Atopobium fossor TaxID=39487 RepID=UPI00041E94DC|nr:shikimate kinase [Atopobium fossor]
MQTLNDGYVVHEGCDHVFFVGFLGAGKSTLARNIGRLFSRPFTDTDRIVERMYHCSLAQIYADGGEQAMRNAETHALKSLQSQKSLLVSCGGGIVESEHNCQLMHEMGTIVYLEGKLSDSLKQIQRTDRRPDLDLCSSPEELFEKRRPLYQKVSDYSVSITNKTFDEVAQITAQLLWEKGLL